MKVIYHWLTQVLDPRHAIEGLIGYQRFFKDWYNYTRMPSAEVIRVVNSLPQVHDWKYATPFDAHYFYAHGWAMRRITALAPAFHVDIGSQVVFANLLAATMPVCFIDFRPLVVNLSGLSSLGGDILNLPFDTGSLSSLSCLHVVEHIGLGRYGDALNPQGTAQAIKELVRVLQPGGNLFLATPIGIERVCFNAHRIYAAATIRQFAASLELREFSVINDSGQYLENVKMEAFDHSQYACGLFWFHKPKL